MWIPKPFEIESKLTSPFNPERKHPVLKDKNGEPLLKPHKGADFSMPIGTDIISPVAGQILIAKTQVDTDGNAFGYGKYIILVGQTNEGTKFQLRFAHLNRILVGEYQYISKGDKIAESGNTGTGTGPHLHFEVRIYNGSNYVAANPINFVDFA